MHDLKKKFPHDEALLTWAKGVKAVYEKAVAWAEAGPDPQSSPHLQRLECLAQQRANDARTLDAVSTLRANNRCATSLMRTSRRVFTRTFRLRGSAWGSCPQQSGRAQRPPGCLIARKISGGTRSPKGSRTRMGLASLFGTWTAQHLNPVRQCLSLLTSTFSLG